MKELIQVRVQYASRQQCCKTHKQPLPLPFYNDSSRIEGSRSAGHLSEHDFDWYIQHRTLLTDTINLNCAVLTINSTCLTT